jgi:hypothetical protein
VLKHVPIVYVWELVLYVSTLSVLILLVYYAKSEYSWRNENFHEAFMILLIMLFLLLAIISLVAFFSVNPIGQATGKVIIDFFTFKF